MVMRVFVCPSIAYVDLCQAASSTHEIHGSPIDVGKKKTAAGFQQPELEVGRFQKIPTSGGRFFQTSKKWGMRRQTKLGESMWKFFSRVMTIVGTVATVIGAAVAVYGFWYPADLTNRASQILDLISQMKPLPDPDQFTIMGILCRETECEAFGIKGLTKDNAQITFSACGPNGVELSASSFWMPRVGGNYELKFPIRPEALLLTAVEMESSTFTVVERWSTPASGDDNRLAEPTVREGKIDCRQAS